MIPVPVITPLIAAPSALVVTRAFALGLLFGALAGYYANQLRWGLAITRTNGDPS